MNASLANDLAPLNTQIDMKTFLVSTKCKAFQGDLETFRELPKVTERDLDLIRSLSRFFLLS